MIKERATHLDDFRRVQALIEEVLKLNLKCSIFAYGQTGAGKTHTFSGGPLKRDGLIPRTIRYIALIAASYGYVRVSVKCVMVQIYKSELVCLLRLAGEPRRPLKVVAGRDGSPMVEGAHEMRCIDLKDHADKVIAIFKQGLDNRLMRSTEVNETSSRSHLLFMLSIFDAQSSRTSKVTFIDLAGSERVACINLKTSLYEEALFINESLKYLGFIVRCLASGRPYQDLVYDENILTSLLRDSIGGTALTFFFVCLSPSDYDREATMDTLRFAKETGKIVNKQGEILPPTWIRFDTPRYIGTKPETVKTTKTVPDLSKDIETLKTFRVKTLHSYRPDSTVISKAFGLTLNDGQQAITSVYDVENTYKVPEDTMIKELVVTFDKENKWINQLSLVYANGKSKQLGYSDTNGNVQRFAFT